MKQEENFRVRELVKKIESHPHREALQADLQQNNACNPFSDESTAMIREMGNVELFDLCETVQKVQCSECLLYWNQGTVYCAPLFSRNTVEETLFGSVRDIVGLPLTTDDVVIQRTAARR